MPALRAGIRLRFGHVGGGIACYPEDRLYQEVAYVAYHFHWGRDEILDLTHKERHRWVKEISAINKKINKSTGGGGGGGQGVIPAQHQSPFSMGGSGGFTLTNPDPDDF